MIYTIYTLSCPETSTPFYIGVTTQELKARMSCHIADSRTYDYPVYRFFKTLPSYPIIEAIEDVETKDKCFAHNIEKYWIEQFRQWGFKLYNSDGNKSIIKYKRTSDEYLYEIYKEKRMKIPYQYKWVAEWLRHPNCMDKQGSYAEIVEIRNNIYMSYSKQRYRDLLKTIIP